MAGENCPGGNVRLPSHHCTSRLYCDTHKVKVYYTKARLSRRFGNVPICVNGHQKLVKDRVKCIYTVFM